jgi:hypothetical protein
MSEKRLCGLNYRGDNPTVALEKFGLESSLLHSLDAPAAAGLRFRRAQK